MPTDGGLAELLICHLVSDVCSHEDGHGDAQFAPDDLGDQLQTLGARVHTLGCAEGKGIKTKDTQSRLETATEIAADVGAGRMKTAGEQLARVGGIQLDDSKHGAEVIYRSSDRRTTTCSSFALWYIYIEYCWVSF